MLKKLLITAVIVASNFGVATMSEAAQGDYENYCGRYGGCDSYCGDYYNNRNYDGEYCGRGGCGYGYGRERGCR